MKRNLINVLISYGCGIVYGMIVSILYKNSASYGYSVFGWQTFISNVCFFVTLAYGLVFSLALIARMGALKHVSYLMQKRKWKRNNVLPKYNTFEEYMQNRQTSTFNLNIFWIPALTFLIITIVFGVIGAQL